MKLTVLLLLTPLRLTVYCGIVCLGKILACSVNAGRECGANLRIVCSKTLIKGKMLSGGTVYLLLMGIS